MTNSYSGNPATSEKDAVRFWISDRGPDVWQLSDEEILYALTQYANPLLAAASIATELAMKWALFVDKAVGDLRISYSQRSRMYADLAAKLKLEGDQSGVSLYSGGTSKADMAAVNANSDRVPQPFARDQFDIPGATGPVTPPDSPVDP